MEARDLLEQPSTQSTLEKLIREYIEFGGKPGSDEYYRRLDATFQIIKEYDGGLLQGYIVKYNVCIDNVYSDPFPSEKEAEEYLIAKLQGWLSKEKENK